MAGYDMSSASNEPAAAAVEVPTGLPPAPEGMSSRSEGASAPESVVDADNPNNEPVADGQQDGTEPGDAAPALPFAPEVAEFATALGFDPAAITDPRAIETMQALHAARVEQVEAAMKQTIDTMREPVQETQQQADAAPVGMSPMQQVQADFSAALQNLCALNGVSTEQELAEVNPGMYQNLANAYNSSLRDAQVEEIQWIHSTETQKIEAARQEQARQEYALNVQAYAEGNLSNMQRENPELVSHLVESGMMDHIEKLSGALGVAPEAMLADQQFCSYVAKAAQAMRMVDNIPALIEKGVQDRIAAMRKAGTAQTVASDSPVPADVGIFSRLPGYGRGVALV